MSSAQPEVLPAHAPNIVLRGGPAWLPDEQRTRYATDVEGNLKVLFGNAYEHFLPTAETVEQEGVRLRVFEWSRRTYVAE
ncbi:DUF5988 family protein [Streptomyces griseus]|uniref:ZinI n=2 Tax=Streptomyces griseus TaxID=1911 RepID=A0A1L2FNN0_STRGR|nr:MULTISPECIES: DUF5988 family protein [Streptomyces]MYR09801.1 hypothetical protein [Streptomyces sp. SID724]MYR53739.1 hypothetical protein [Streptomyces sp. SID4928]MYT77565.1 hypothetical protein [Streptomyces sp. SID8364]ANZ22992.1 ZinI [Streptomyces griseus]EGE45717.1 hypothetical protein SACT1_6414 [Streptomyces sp. ACT-1]